jgi:hypothetical protein
MMCTSSGVCGCSEETGHRVGGESDELKKTYSTPPPSINLATSQSPSHSRSPTPFPQVRRPSQAPMPEVRGSGPPQTALRLLLPGLLQGRVADP